jgi:flagellar export protein FliJ
MSGRRFRYALQPLLLKRRWTLEARQADLAELNGLIQRERAALDGVRAEVEAARGQAQQLAVQDGLLSVDVLMLASRYLAQCEQRMQAQAAQVERLEDQRRALLDALYLAQRELDAMNDHRQREQAAFRQACQKEEYTELDELWNGRPGKGGLHVN